MPMKLAAIPRGYTFGHIAFGRREHMVGLAKHHIGRVIAVAAWLFLNGFRLWNLLDIHLFRGRWPTIFFLLIAVTAGGFRARRCLGQHATCTQPEGYHYQN